MGKEGEAEIREAIAGTAAIEDKAEALWGIYQQELTFRQGIEADIAALTQERDKLLDYATVRRRMI